MISLDNKAQAASISILSNSILAVVKLIVGLYTGAVSIVSEAIHSAVDLVAAIIAFWAVKTSEEAPDCKHPFGHGKIENISGAIEAVLIIVAALWICYECLQKLVHPVNPEFLGWGIGVMLLSIGVNLVVSRYLYIVARKTHSHALEADALHLAADVYTSVGVLIGLVLIKITGLLWLDPVVALIMAGVIFRAGYKMTQKSMAELLDISLPEAERHQIIKVLVDHPMVLNYAELKTRRSGSKRIINVYIILDKDLCLQTVHTICDELELKIKEVLAPCEVIIHPEPYLRRRYRLN